MTAIDDIAAERRRQVEAEGWTREHDDQHSDGCLARAAGCYALHAGRSGTYESAREEIDRAIRMQWPFDEEWWKPGRDPRRDLVKAAALIVAEIERLDRASGHVAPPADPTADPVLQLRYDVLVREVQRERADLDALREKHRALQAEAAKMRVALGLEHDNTPRPARNMDAGHG